MKCRRSFLYACLAVLCVLPHAAGAAEPKTVGILSLGGDPADKSSPSWSSLYARMRELEWIDGRNILYLPRGVNGDLARLDTAVKELVGAEVAVIVTTGSQEALAAARATRSIPIVTLHPSDPVDLGLAASLARPGGNVTGQTLRAPGLGAKQFELIAEMQPAAKRFVFAQGSGVYPMLVKELRAAAQHRGVSFKQSDVPETGDLNVWIGKAKREGAEAMILLLDARTFPQGRRAALANALISHKLPAICEGAAYAESGCLMSYGASFSDFYSRGAEHVDKILRGAKPGDMPIEQPTKFKLVINMKTAKALGITIPKTLLVRADEVVQ